MVNTGNETGWVFGGYLFHNPVNSKIKNTQIAKMIAGCEKSLFSDNIIFRIEGAIEYYNNDILVVYERNTKESDSFPTNHNTVFFIEIEETPGWYYLLSDDYEIQGYIYLYDISEKSFYGNLEGDGENGYTPKSRLKTEYEIIKQNQNIKRYGPLLSIDHNGKTIAFLDTYNGISGKINLLLEHYPEYNEILMYEQYYEGGYYFIFNLEQEEVRCKLAMYPYFNTSKTYFISYGWESEALNTTLRIYKINNGFYEEIFNRDIFTDHFYTSSPLRSISWINDQEAYIDCGEAGRIIVKTDDKGNFNVVNNLAPLREWWENP